MSSSQLQTPVQPRRQVPIERNRHRTRYYVHRVKESFTTRLCKLICSIVLTLLFAIAFVAFVLWLSLRPHRPRFSVISFSVTGLLNQDNPGFQNAVIAFNATARNPNQNVDIYYDEMSGSVFYREQQLGSTPLLLPFHQPHKNTTYVNGVFTGASLTVNEDSWKQALASGTVVFRLELTAGIRFKVARWTTKHHRMHASCAVGVGPDGQITSTYKGRKCSTYFD